MDKFIPLNRTPIDEEYTLEQLTSNFQSLKTGLPELIKNSSDAYSRRSILNPTNRQIIVILSDGRGKNLSRLGILDFAGASIEDFEGEKDGGYEGWVMWSSRTSSRKDLSMLIEGGHGNGGKAFMTRGCSVESFLVSSYNFKRNKMGFRFSESPSRFRPGWFQEDGKLIKELEDKNPKESLNNELKFFGLTFENLPDAAKKVLNIRKSWTLAELVGIKYTGDLKGRHFTQGYLSTIMENIKSHPQTSYAIESSQVWVYHNGSLLTEKTIKRDDLTPLKGFETQVFEIPKYLVDPETKIKVCTWGKNNQSGKLILKTSRRNLRTGGKNRALNAIRFKNKRNIVAMYHLSKYTDSMGGHYIHGEVILDSLIDEHLDGTTRQYLSYTTLTRALEEWITGHIARLAEEIQKKWKSKDNILEKRETDNRLYMLRDLMKNFLNPEGSFGSGENENEKKKSKNKKITRKRKGYGFLVAEIDLEDGRDEISVPIGVSIPIIYSCRDENGRTVPSPLISWHCEDRSIVDIIPDEGIKGLGEGDTEIWVEDFETGTISNKVKVKVHNVKTVKLLPPKEPIKQGQRIKINSIVEDIHENIISKIALRYTPDSLEGGTIGRMGMFTAGNYEGEVEITAQYGPEVDDKISSVINILGEKIEREGGSGMDESEIPVIMLCGREAPGCSDLSKDQRTYYPQPTDPTIIDDMPQWRKRGIIWINHESAESRSLLERSGGSTPRIKISSKTFTEFLALKCFEILKRLKASQNLEGEGNVEPDRVIAELNAAEAECVDFIEGAFSLVDSWF